MCALRWNDPHLPKLTSAIVFLAALFFGASFLGSVCLSVLTFALVKAGIEWLADHFALRYASTEVLRGGIRLLTLMKQKEIEENNQKPCFCRLKTRDIQEPFDLEIGRMRGKLTRLGV